MVYVTPKSPPRDFAVFASKIQLLSKMSAAKFLHVKTFSGNVVATSFLYLKVHKRIAGGVLIDQQELIRRWDSERELFN